MEDKKNKPRTKRVAVEPQDSSVMIANTMKMAKKKDVPAFCQKIRYYRLKLGLEQKQLGAKIGVIGNAVCNWENGNSRPDITLLPRICEALGITMNELFDIPAPHVSPEMEKLLGEHEEDVQRVMTKYLKLSVGHQYAVESMMDALNDAEDAEICKHIIVKTEFSKQLAAGFDPGEEFDDKGEEILLYDTEENQKGDCVFTVSGDSMEPEFHNGDKVLVQRYPNCPAMEPGDVGAFITGNETYIKEYQRDGLHSYNKKYKTMKFTDEENVYLIGKVIKKLEPSDIVTFEDAMRYQRVMTRKKD